MFEEHNPDNSTGQANSGRFIDIENKLRRNRRSNRSLLRTHMRLKSIRQLLMGRYGGPCPPEKQDFAEFYLDATLPLLMWKAEKRGVHNESTCPMTWAVGWTPTLLDRGPEWFTTKIEAVGRPRWMTDDEIGELLAVEAWEINAYGLKLIGAVDRSRAERDVERQTVKRARDAARKREKRRQDGRPSRAPRSGAKPWKALGLSRATYYRRRRDEQDEQDGYEWIIRLVDRNIVHMVANLAPREVPSHLRLVFG